MPKLRFLRSLGMIVVGGWLLLLCSWRPAWAFDSVSVSLDNNVQSMWTNYQITGVNTNTGLSVLMWIYADFPAGTTLDGSLSTSDVVLLGGTPSSVSVVGQRLQIRSQVIIFPGMDVTVSINNSKIQNPATPGSNALTLTMHNTLFGDETGNGNYTIIAKTPTVTPSFTSTFTPTFTPTITQSMTPTITRTFTATWTSTFTPTKTPTRTATFTPTFTPTHSPTFTSTFTPTATPTVSPTATFTATGSPTISPTLTITATHTPTGTVTASSTSTPSLTLTPTATPSGTPTASFTATLTRTQTGTPTPTPSITPTPTFSPTSTPSFTETATLPGTATSTSTITTTVTATPSASVTPTYSPTAPPTQTSTATPGVTVMSSPTSTLAVMPVGPGQIVAYPNPLKGGMLWFYYVCQAPAQVSIEIVNVTGEKVVSLTDMPEVSGVGRTSWDASKLAPGVYLYRAKIEDANGARIFGWKKLAVVR